MDELTGAVLPLAAGVALSPVPVVSVVLVLTRPRGATAAVAFAVGWVLALAAALVALTALSARLGLGAGEGGPVRAALQLALGALLVVLGVRQWRRGEVERGEVEQGDAEQGTHPDGAGPGDAGDGPLRAFGLGAALAALNPKNVAIMVTVAGLLSVAWPDGVAVPVVVFVVTGSLTVVAPVLLRVVAPAASGRLLAALRGWLERHGAAITGAVLLVIGVLLVGRGLSGW